MGAKGEGWVSSQETASNPAEINLADNPLLVSIYGLLRSELWGEMARQVQQISYVHSRPTFLPGKSKI